jgi:hypothetical protein
MNQSKLESLFSAARNEIPPAPEPGFDRRVLRALPAEPPAPLSVFDQIAELFPRLASAAVLVLALCAVTELCLSNNKSNLALGIAQASEEWLFAVR